MNTFLRTISALLAGLMLAMVLATAPAAAAPSLATVRVNSGGDLVVFPNQGDTTIQINQGVAGSYVVWATPAGGVTEVHTVSGVTRDVRIDFRTHVGIDVEIGDGGPFSVPRRLVVLSNSGVDWSNDLLLYDVSVGDDIYLRGSFAIDIHRANVVDDVRYVANGGDGYIGFFDSTAGGDFIARAAETGSFSSEISRSDVGRVVIVGNEGADSAYFSESSLGPAPRILLLGGDDYVGLGYSDWTGTLRVRTGNGDDRFSSDGSNSGGPIDVLLQDGDDRADFAADLPNNGVGSLLNGGRGNDRLELDVDAVAATVRWFDDIVDPGNAF